MILDVINYIASENTIGIVVIQISDLSIDFDRTRALSNVNIKIEPGEVLALIGPNGAGKTTLFRAIVGLITPSTGQILVNGKSIEHNPKNALQSVGLMPDFSPLYDQLKVVQFMDVFAMSYLLPAKESASRIRDCLEIVGLWDKRDSYLKGLSRGMKQRLMLAKTLIPDPEVLLLDEPASGLDPQGRILLKDIINQLRGRQRAIIISSHILAEMSEFCTSVAILEKGQLIVSGPVQQIAAKLGRKTILEIETLEQPESVITILQQNNDCSQINSKSLPNGNIKIETAFSGSPQLASQLLSTIVAQGCAIVGFRMDSSTIEDIYRRVGSKELS